MQTDGQAVQAEKAAKRSHKSLEDNPEQVYKIEGMHCASCVGRLESGLRQALPQAQSISVNLATKTARIKGSHINPEAVMQAIQAIGYQARPVLGTAKARSHAHDTESADAARKKLFVAIGLTVPVFAMHMFGWHFPGSGWVQFALTTPVLFYCGREIFSGAWRLAKRVDSDMNTLIAMGAGVAWGFSTISLVFPQAVHTATGTPALYFETAAVIVTLILLGRTLEARARKRAGEAIEALMSLQPDTTLVRQPDGQFAETPITDIQPNTVVMVRPGGRIPIDGTVLEGHSTVNESMLTGESLPISKKPGDTVIGGSLNESGNLIISVTRTGADTTLARMIDLVERAQGEKPPIQRLADRIAGIFVPIVLGLALLTLAGWMLTGHSLAAALNATIAVLVISCPCALGLATPTAIQVGLGRGAQSGILIQDPAGMELAHKLQLLVFDKTGTLTLGKPVVTGFQLLGNTPEDTVIQLAAALEAQSEHPLARAIVDFAQARTSELPSLNVTDFQSETGAGIRGTVDGKSVLVGKPDFLTSQGVGGQTPSIPADQTPVMVAIDGEAAGLFLISDPLKPEASDAIRQLRNMGVYPMMLSGDRPETALNIGTQAGLAFNEIFGNMSPQAKLEKIKALQQHGLVGMAGDGINDAPSLAQADVSIAMGHGTDVAMQTAQITLVQGTLTHAVEAIQLSRAIMRTVRQNLFWAFFYNVVAIPLAALGQLSPMIAAGAMAVSSLTVVLNSLRLRGFRYNKP